MKEIKLFVWYSALTTIFAFWLLLGLSGCDKQSLVTEPVATESNAQDAAATSEVVKPQDLSDVKYLPNEAKKMLDLAAQLEVETKASCRKDDAEMWRIVREAASAGRAWKNLNATDLHRIQFSGCDLYLGDIESLANICVASIYSTNNFQYAERRSKEDSAQCKKDLKQKWPRSIEQLDAEMNE